MRKEIVYGPWAEFISPSGVWRVSAEGVAAVADLTAKYKGFLPNLLAGGRFAWMVTTLRVRGWDDEDLKQAATAGALRSALSFAPGRISPKSGKPVEFTSYAHGGVVNEFSAAITAINRNAMESKFARIGVVSPGGDFDLDPECPDNEDDRLTVDHARHVAGEAMRALTERERAVIRCRYGLDGEPMSLNEVARSVLGGVSKERARQIEAVAVEKMRRQLSGARPVPKPPSEWSLRRRIAHDLRQSSGPLPTSTIVEMHANELINGRARVWYELTNLESRGVVKRVRKGRLAYWSAVRKEAVA